MGEELIVKRIASYIACKSESLRRLVLGSLGALGEKRKEQQVMHHHQHDNRDADVPSGTAHGEQSVFPQSPIITPPTTSAGPSEFVDTGNMAQDASDLPIDQPILHTHPLADLFPMLSEDAFLRFKEDIRLNGQQVPIVVHEGRVLDGRNRLRACYDLCIIPVVKEWSGEAGSPEAFVIAANLNRRHLSQSQKALSAARLILHREKHEGAVSHDGSPGRENFPALRKSSEEVAQLFSISHKSVEMARKLILHGSKELIDLVDAGAVAVSAASLVASLPVEEQRCQVALGPSGIRAAAREMRAGVRKRNRRRTAKENAPQAVEEGGELVLRVGSRWRSQIEAAMQNRSEFERALGVGLKIKLEKGQRKGDDSSPTEPIQSVL